VTLTNDMFSTNTSHSCQTCSLLDGVSVTALAYS